MTGIISDNVGRPSGLIKAASGGGGGVWNLIKTLTASADGTLDFVHGTADVVLDSTYPIYKFVYINCHPATDDVAFSFQGTTDGSNFNTTITSTHFESYHNEADSVAGVGYQAEQDLAQSTSFQTIQKDYGNGNDESGSGYIHLYNPSSTTFVKHFIGVNQSYHSGDYVTNDYLAGYFNTTSAITGIQFKMSSGNIDAGKIKLYGIKDSA